jgi:hypothetical protein
MKNLIGTIAIIGLALLIYDQYKKSKDKKIEVKIKQ